MRNARNHETRQVNGLGQGVLVGSVMVMHGGEGCQLLVHPLQRPGVPQQLQIRVHDGRDPFPLLHSF